MSRAADLLQLRYVVSSLTNEELAHGKNLDILGYRKLHSSSMACGSVCREERAAQVPFFQLSGGFQCVLV